MKLLLSISILLFMSSSIVLGSEYSYEYTLTKPAVPLGSMGYSDEKIDILFRISEMRVHFILKNKTEMVMKVIWDEASLVRLGKAGRVIHSGIKLIDTDKLQPPTTIYPNAELDNIAMPTGWDRGGPLTLFPISDFGDPKVKEQILKLKGQKLGLYLPIEQEGEVIGYNFEFTITNVQEKETDLLKEGTDWPACVSYTIMMIIILTLLMKALVPVF